VDPQRFERIFVRIDSSVREAIEAIDAGGAHLALVTDEQRRLIGLVTDGDLRRSLLGGAQLEDTVEDITHRDAIVAPYGVGNDDLRGMMERYGVEQIPLIDEGEVVDLVLLKDLIRRGVDDRENKVVIMAGGEGQRLRPLTEDVPKPMLPVGSGNTPLLETVLGQVKRAGFGKVLMAVRYRADIIENHFGDGEDFGVAIDYVREDEALGSAGALQLVRDQLDEPFIVMNADLLTNVDLEALLRFHREEQNAVTVGVRQYVLEVPYGVVDIEGSAVTGLREKPSVPFFVNAGLYAVSPAAVEMLPAEVTEFNMTDLIDAALTRGDRVGSFPVREYWLDIGQLADYERAHGDHATYFVGK
jgi:dTDP-glucose pyrophosphorylase